MSSSFSLFLPVEFSFSSMMFSAHSPLRKQWGYVQGFQNILSIPTSIELIKMFASLWAVVSIILLFCLRPWFLWTFPCHPAQASWCLIWYSGLYCLYSSSPPVRFQPHTRSILFSLAFWPLQTCYLFILYIQNRYCQLFALVIVIVVHSSIIASLLSEIKT